jgi:uncharacterized short protein YbdD (DUF466 family)
MNARSLSQMRCWLRQARGAYLQMFGIPDYERYLAHMADHHPELTPLSRREFAAQAIDRRYNGGGGRRCC